jgi:NDP-sugar pyrophosphorylase family protein
MKVAILAGGHARLAEETEIRTKPMVEIGGHPILWHIMRHYPTTESHYGFKDFVIALGYKTEYIKKYFTEYCSLSGNVFLDVKMRRIATSEDAKLGWTVNLVETGMSEVESNGSYRSIQGDDTQFEKEHLEKLARDRQLMAFQHESFWQCMDTMREKQILQTCGIPAGHLGKRGSEVVYASLAYRT